MATCVFCGREMLLHMGCTWQPEAGTPRKPYPVGEKDPCHDCGCAPGTLHHPGCDMERCADCGGQAISCGCHEDDEEDED